MRLSRYIMVGIWLSSIQYANSLFNVIIFMRKYPELFSCPALPRNGAYAGSNIITLFALQDNLKVSAVEREKGR